MSNEEVAEVDGVLPAGHKIFLGTKRHKTYFLRLLAAFFTRYL
jgi:hypothetical protein